MRSILIMTVWLTATPVLAESLCYYWVEPDGTVTSYQRPPFDISTPALLSTPDGRLIIAPAQRCLDNRKLNQKPATQAAAPQPGATPPPPAPPAPAAPPPVEQAVPRPEPAPDLQLQPIEPAPQPRPEPAPESTPEIRLDPGSIDTTA